MRIPTTHRPQREKGIVILLVAVMLLFVVGAIAALAIDVVTLYTARSEAQLAADSAALAGARALVNSGITSVDPTDPGYATMLSGGSGAEDQARIIATRVATGNKVGGQFLSGAGACAGGGEISVCFNDSTFPSNPQVTVTIQRTDLPTFFARLLGRTVLAVSATATAEAYNPSRDPAKIPVAPTCVKPWLLPNLDPSNPPNTIFDSAGNITNPALLGWSGTPMSLACGGAGCTPTPLPGPSAWKYYPGDDGPGFFPPPTSSLPTTCSPVLSSNYQQSIAGCIPVPIACNATSKIDINAYANRGSETADAVNCLTHATATLQDADQIDLGYATVPFQFDAGTNNPITGAATKRVLVSSSLVTVPVFDHTLAGWQTTGDVQIIGFVQLFLNPDSIAALPTPSGNVNAKVINMVGCGTGATGTPILGNGASAVPVRLVTPP